MRHLAGVRVGYLHGRARTSDPTYYALTWDRFRASGRAHVATATQRGEVVGSMLHLVCGDEMVWFAGGQTEAGNPVGAGKLLVWRSVLRARDLGMRHYNMWGTATSGLARYKEGFGAHHATYVGTRAMLVHRPADVLVRAAWRLQQVSRRADAVRPFAPEMPVLFFQTDSDVRFMSKAAGRAGSRERRTAVSACTPTLINPGSAGRSRESRSPLGRYLHRVKAEIRWPHASRIVGNGTTEVT